MAFTNCPQAQDETRLTLLEAALVRVGDQGRVEQSRSFDGYFAGEIGAHQQRPFSGDLAVSAKLACGECEVAFPTWLPCLYGDGQSAASRRRAWL